MDYDNGAAAGGVVGAIAILFGVLLYLLILAAVYVVFALALSRFFRKVGVEPWIAWVPVYNYWKWLEVGGQNGALSLLMFVPYAGIVVSVFLAIGMYRTGMAFRKDGSWVVLGIFLPFVWCFLLARESEIYDPGLIAARGYPPPRAGFGSVAPGATPPPPPPTAPAA